MGVVYRARDPRLDRDVAIKLIPETFAADQSRARRFEQEARAAGQLNHPNILAVYDVGLHAGAPYIVSELLEGESLRDRLQAGALPSRKAIDYARQTAEGLAAAHARGIVHRDLKPDNLFVTSDGRVKILDFGIAKLTRPGPDGAAQPTGAATQTERGLVVGTAGYMSPEQVRGEEVDARSDLFSFGTILYEMLSGRSAFARSTSADTMAAILKEDPPEPLSQVSPGLARIVSRCLEKSRDTRFQSARDLAFALEVLSDTHPTAATGDSPALPRRWPVRLGIAVGALSVIAAAASWLTRASPPPASDNPLAAARFTYFTNWEGMEAAAAISPDGRFVAFIADKDGESDIFVSQVGTGTYLNLTPEVPSLSTPNILKTFGFSGDGSDIWFTDPGDSSNPHRLIPLTGGAPRPFLGEHTATPSWSPDDTRLVYFVNEGGDPFFLADRLGGNARPLVVDTKGFFEGVVHSHNPVWSQDGQWIYFSHGLEPTEMNIWRVRPSGGAPEQLTAFHSAAIYLAPIDSRTLLYTARDDDGSGPWLWSLDVETRKVQRVTSALQRFSSVSASRDGRRIVAAVTVSDPTVTLWRAPIGDRPAEARDVQPFAVTSPRAHKPRFGGTALFYLSARGAGDGLWRFRDGKAFEVWKPADESLSEPPAVSPDGSLVAILVRQEGKPRLSIMSADGTNARTLAGSMEIVGSGGRGAADWSPDGGWIVVAGADARGAGVFKIPVDGGAAVRLASGQAVNPVWSPKGDLIVYGGAVVGGTVPLLGVRPDGRPVELPELRVRIGGGHRFLRDGSGLVYLPRGQSTDFWLLDLAAKKSRPLTHLSDQGGFGAFDLTPDGKAIVFDRSRENSDIALIELPK
jgi:serine/threonine protein kinase